MELQIHLAEYSALREEILQLIKWRDGLVFISLGITGALFSFTFSKDMSPLLATRQWTPLYLVTPLSSLVGGLWMVNTWRINRLGLYIKEILTKRIEAILNSGLAGDALHREKTVLEWQSSDQRNKYHWERRLLSSYVYISTFVVSGIAAQLILLNDSKGTLQHRVFTAQFPPFYIINWIIIISFAVAFMIYLKKGIGEKPKGVIKIIR